MNVHVILLFCYLQYTFAYKNVVLVHGIMSEARKLQDMKRMIEQAHPGTNVTVVHLYPELQSVVPLQIQLKLWKEKIQTIMDESIDGIHLICHSQGGLICQGIVEYCDDHNVDTFIALSSPLMGQFGVPYGQYLPKWLSGERTKLSKLMYTDWVQERIAFSNYWRDPRDSYTEAYLKGCKYLPILLNNPDCPNVISAEAENRKQNFLKLRKLVLIGGPDDGVITPWQSSQFGFYDENYGIIHMENQTLFQQDWFGLQTLFRRGDVIVDSVPDVKHTDWHGNMYVFSNFVEPFLT